MAHRRPGEEFLHADSEFLTLLQLEADKRLAAQLQLLTAADQRASGILAGATALSAAGFAIAADQITSGQYTELFFGSSAFALIASCSALAAVSALWPVSVDPQGWSPNSFLSDIEKGKSMNIVKMELIHYLNVRISRNRESSRRITRRIKLSMFLLSISPIAGATVAASASDSHLRGFGILGLFGLTLSIIWIVRLLLESPPSP